MSSDTPGGIDGTETQQTAVSSTPTRTVLRRTPLTGISSSLKERLKKCGRYHPMASPSVQHLSSSANTPKSISRQLPRKILMETSNSTPTTHLQTDKVDCRTDVDDNKTEQIQTTQNSTVWKKCLLEFPVTVDKDSTPVPLNTPHKSSGEVDKASRNVDSPCHSGLSVLSQQKHPKNSNFPGSSGSVRTGGDCCHYLPHKAQSSSDSATGLQREKTMLLGKVADRKEVLRKLTMVKTYRTKNDLQQLQKLIDKWRLACQEAVHDLQQLIPEPRPSLTALVKQLGVVDLLGYNEEDECFDVT